MGTLRKEIAKEDQWNIEAIYPTLKEWENHFQKVVSPQNPRWPSLIAYHHQLKNPEKLVQFLEELFQVERDLYKLYTYAHLKHDEDITEPDAKGAYNRILSALTAFKEELVWFEPELLAFSDEEIAATLTNPLLKEYYFYLEKTFRQKPHVLSADKEYLLAMSSKALQASQKAFSALNDADLKFPTVLDSEEKPHELTHGKLGIYMRSRDRILRKNSFLTYHNQYQKHQNTFAELLAGQIESHVFFARARNFKNALDASLFSKNVNASVYHALIEAVHSKIDSLHRYMDLRKKVLGLRDLHLYDLQVPLVTNYEMKVPYNKAEELIIESVSPLGNEYQQALQAGLLYERWVDRYESQNKRSGAYSSGCYDTQPYILMNYKDIIRDVFTLAHEAGHSMHSYMSRKYQPFHYGSYSIFVAEVASTFNEELLLQTLLKNAKTKEEKIFLLTQKIEDIRGTLFRQTQFAEFELMLHQMAEKHIPFTPETLNEEYLKLNQFYYGPQVVLDAEVAIEWARIPHFYYNFYVFQYATGISAALSLADQVTKGGIQEQQAYLNFLSSGDSLYPIDALKLAGVDMSTSTPVTQAIEHFDALLKQLEELLIS